MNDSPRTPNDGNPLPEPATAEPIEPVASTEVPAPPTAASPWSRDAGPGGFAPPSLPNSDAPTLPPVAAPAPAPVWSRDGEAAAAQAATPSAAPFDPVPRTEAERPRRSKVVVGAAVVGVLAVGAAGVFAVSRMTGGPEGGAATPAELGTTLLTAIENEDVLGMVDTLLPGERDAFREPMIEFVSELTRLEVLAPEADLSKIAGVDFEVTDEAVTERSTNVADIVNVDFAGSITATVDGAVVPVGALITDNLDQADIDELRAAKETQTDDLDFWLTAVEEDGRWYFSLLHSAAEAARTESGSDEPIPVEGLAALGGETPEAAVDQMFADIEALDLRGLIQGLHPGEAQALQRYAPMFLDDVEMLRDEALTEVDFSWSITRKEYRIEGEGDARTVFIDALAIEGQVDDSTFTYEVDGECVRVTFDEVMEPIEQCYSTEAANEALDEFLVEVPELQELVAAAREAFADVAPIGLELRQVDGQWYVSPIATMSEAMLKVMRALDRQEIDRMIELGRELDEEELFDQALGGVLGDELFGTSDDFAFEESTTQEFTTDDFATEESFGEGTFVVAEDDCWSQPDAASATACFDTQIASGAIDPSSVPVVLRYPECGYVEAGWDGTVYEMDDATFAATVESARQCFLDKVATGEITLYELPTEIAFFECFEGRNWYTTYDDPAYDERYNACIEAGYAAQLETTLEG